MTDNLEDTSSSHLFDTAQPNLTFPEVPIGPVDITTVPHYWIPAEAGTFNWDDGANWQSNTPGTYPNNSADNEASLNSILSSGNATINLNENIGLYRLQLSSSNNNYGFNINGGSPSGYLTISDLLRVSTTLNNSPYGSGIHNINSNIFIGSPNLFCIAGSNSGTILNINGLVQPSSGFNSSIIVYQSNAGIINFNGVLSDNGSNVLSFRRQAFSNTKTYLLGNNTYTGSTRIESVTNSPVYFNSIFDINSNTPSSFGIPSLSNEQIILGNGGSVGGYISYIGQGTHSSNRSFLLNSYTSATIFEVVNPNATLILDGSVSTIDGNVSSNTGILRLAGAGTGYFPSIPGKNVGVISLDKIGGGKWILTDKNYYIGTTRISSGILQLSKKLSLYSNPNGTDIIDAFWNKNKISTAYNANTTLALNVGGSGEFTESDIATLINRLCIGVGNGSGLNKNSYWGFDTTNSSGQIFTISTPITNSSGNSYAGALGVRKLGPNTLVLSGNNSYSHDTIIDSGTLTVGHVSGLGSFGGSISINNGSILNLNSYAVNKSGTVTINNGIIQSGSINGICNYIVEEGETLNGSLNGIGSFTKNGSGEFRINSTNSYFGSTNINGGKLIIKSASNKFVPGPLGTGGTLNLNWNFFDIFYNPLQHKLEYIGENNVSTNTFIYPQALISTIESNSVSGSITFDSTVGSLYRYNPVLISYKTQIGIISVWLPYHMSQTPGGQTQTPTLWRIRVWRWSNATSYISQNELDILFPPPSDEYNPPETFLYSNISQIIDILKIQNGVTFITTPYAGSSADQEIFNPKQLFGPYVPGYTINLTGSSTSKKNSFNCFPSICQTCVGADIIKTGKGTWSFGANSLVSHVNYSYFSDTGTVLLHKEGTVVFNARLSYGDTFLGNSNVEDYNNYLHYSFDDGNDYTNDIRFLINNVYSDEVAVLPKRNKSRQKVYIGNIRTPVNSSEWYPRLNLIETFQPITIMCVDESSFYIGMIANEFYVTDLDIESPPITIGSPTYNGKIILKPYFDVILRPESINVNFGSLALRNSDMKTDSLYLNKDTFLLGDRNINTIVSGPGNISPRSVKYESPNAPNKEDIPTQLIISHLDASKGTKFHFRFTNPVLTASDDWENWSNDILLLAYIRLYDAYSDLSSSSSSSSSGEGEDRFLSPLTQANVINLYFPDTITDGQTYQGGFIVENETDLLSKIQNATYKLYVKTNNGNVVYNGQQYALLNNKYSVIVETDFFEQLQFGVMYTGGLWGDSYEPRYVYNVSISKFRIVVNS
jgi:autotransporter-associated beta strand protein